MRSTLFIVLAAAAALPATAQVPAPRPRARPAPQPAPTPRPTPRLLSSGDWSPLYLDSGELFGLMQPPLPSWPDLPPMPMEPMVWEPFPMSDLAPMELPPMAMEFELPEPPPPRLFLPGETPWPEWSDEGGGRGEFKHLRPDQGSPEDSLWRSAREALNRGEYARASALFRSLEQRYPRSRVAPAALYYQAFSLYRSGSSDELRTALEALKAQQVKYPEAAADPDAATLRTRLYAALASRGDAQAAAALRAATASGTACDKEDIDVRAEALNALAQINPPEARPTLKKVLARRDDCSVNLRRRAVYILARNGTEESSADLLEVAKGDPSPEVRHDAIVLIGRSPGTATVRMLEQLFKDAPDDRTRQSVLSALRQNGGPEAKRALRGIVERGDLPERMRAEAIQQLGSSWGKEVELRPSQWSLGVSPRSAGDEEDAAYLRNFYVKTDSRTVKSAIISSVARIGGTASDQWLLGLAKNRDEDIGLRREALARIRTSALSVDDLGKLFDALSERELRSAVVSQLANREEPAATDKLIEIARSGTDPVIRRQAISALARKKDPRTTKLLLDLVEKP
jgi:HEAT repeat protein